ncbi:MAG: LmeA family phospholipid-binding protein [Propionibacteriaceae bacterium]
MPDQTPESRPEETSAEPPEETPAEPPAKVRRYERPYSRGRQVFEAIVVAVVLLGLLWSADALARSAAESLLSRNIRDAIGAEADPEVTVQGRFFLAQVITGAYREVDVRTVGISGGPLRIERVDSTLFDVRVPFHDVLLRDIRTVGVGRSDQVAVLTYADLNAYFDATGRPLRIGAADGGLVRLSGAVTVLGRTVDVTADASVSAGDGQLTITPTRIDTSNSMSAAARLLLGQRLRLSVPMGTLPFGSQLTRITPGPESITVVATGSHIVVNP